MLVIKAFRYRVYPTPEQIVRLESWNNALRFLWNLALEQRKMGLARSARCHLTAFGQMREMTPLRAALPWLADVPRNVCAQLLVELDKAWQRCFHGLARLPKWKRKGAGSLSLCEPHSRTWHLDGTTVHFPKLGCLRAIVHRPLEGKPKTCTLKRDGDQWYVSIICEIQIHDPRIRLGPTVGIDRGIINTVADSDGKLIQNPRFYEAIIPQLARAKHTVARRKKGSKNSEKAKLVVTRLHRKVRRQRAHFTHQLSHDYAKSHGTVVVEILNIEGMMQANYGLARSISDSGWGFVKKLRYKLAWSGGTLGEVNAMYSSQTCSVCRHVDAASRISQAVFCCTACGHREHADINAAKVLESRWRPSVQPVKRSCRLRTPRRSRKESTDPGCGLCTP